jgi:hypothetical protein
VDFIPLTIGRYNMSVITDKIFNREVDEVKEWILSPKDRCDSCNAEALVKVTGISGDLLFCGHHYNKIMAIPDGYNSMMSFMISIVDERDKLKQDRLKD